MLKFFMFTSKLGAVGLSACATLMLSLHKGWLEAKIFSTLSPEQTFSAFIWTLSLSAVLVFVSIIGHFISNRKPEKSITANNSSYAFDNSGKNNTVNIDAKS